MGFRFSKSIRLGKFLRLNLSRSGIGASIGIGGLRLGTGTRGTRFTADLPGAGTSYVKQWGTGKGKRTRAESSRARARKDLPEAQRETPQSLPSSQGDATRSEIPAPGFFAAREEKELVAGLNQYNAGRFDAALEHFLSAAESEAGAAVLAASILAERAGGEAEAIRLLERVVQSDEKFPTELMKKYLTGARIQIAITPSVTAEVDLNGLAATLLLVELYQKANRADEAIGLLEELEELAGDRILTLSLCELYASRNVWDGILERARVETVDDDVSLETAIFRARAMQEKNLHEAATVVLTEALRRKKNRRPQLVHEAMYRRAISYAATGKTKQADREFQKLYAEASDFRDVAERIAATQTTSRKSS
jgi:tetratricopeptide (TPR) repeat protein